MHAFAIHGARLALLALALGATGCPKPVSSTAPSAPIRVEVPPSIPRAPGALSPALTAMQDGETYDLDVHLAVGECAACHATIASEWNDSVHALSSLSNPFYRASFVDFREKTGKAESAFCAACHDPGLLFDGAVKGELDPDAMRTHVGVSCATCHGVASASVDGNGSYTLSTRAVPVPSPGDEASLAAHKARVAGATLRTDALCISCHKGFLSPDTGHEVFLPAIDEFTPWHRSGYADNTATRIVDAPVKSCRGCHMPEVGEGKDAHNSHRFIGGHLTLARMKGSEEQIDAVVNLLKGAATLDIPAYGVGTKVTADAPVPPKAGEPFWFDVVIHNREVGHDFPGGARDLRDTWLEVSVEDRDGKVIARAGTDHEESGDDESAFVLHAYVTKKDGTIVGDHSVHDIRTAAYVNTIPPKDSRVVRYTFTPEPGVDLDGVRVVARLRHRRLTESFRRAVCDVSKRDSDRAFAEAAGRYRAFARLDPCDPQPVLDIDTHTVALDGGLADNGRPTWQRHYERGLGLEKHLQEDLAEAVDAYRRALALAVKDGNARAEAKVHFALGGVLARLGRTDDAFEELSAAEAIVGEHAAIHFARGRALARVFRNEDALMWLQRASALEDDDRVWQRLAIAAGSVGRPEVAYDAAQRGLAISPRDPDLLRSQMLALKKLDAPEAWRSAAAAAFDAFKLDELAPHVRDRCSKQDVHCQQGRRPVRTIALH